MAGTLVIYFSVYGTTKKYAEWLASELEADVCPVNKLKQRELGKYEVIILGSSIYGGSIRGLDILVRNCERLINKKIIVFTCGIADVSDIDRHINVYFHS